MHRQFVEQARQHESADGALGSDGNRLMRGIVNNGQTLDDAPLSGAIKHKVHRPDLVSFLWTRQWLSIRNRYLLPFAAFNLQSRFSIEPLDTLVVDRQPILTKFQINHAGAIPTMSVG